MSSNKVDKDGLKSPTGFFTANFPGAPHGIRVPRKALGGEMTFISKKIIQ